MTTANNGNSEQRKGKIEIKAGGPYIVSGGIPLYEDAIVESQDGSGLTYDRVREFDVGETYSLCRCGKSKNKPFCDGEHKKAGFKGEEVASRAPYADRAQEYKGGGVNLFDDNRCAYARLCHRNGVDVWNLTIASGSTEEVKEQAIEGAWHCPTGRLESHDAKTGKVYEDDFELSIVLLEDIQKKVSGPAFVRGGVELIGADGYVYENRNRYALCRCGQSQDIPFCDAMHVPVKFYDDSPSFDGQDEGADASFTKAPHMDAPSFP